MLSKVMAVHVKDVPSIDLEGNVMVVNTRINLVVSGEIDTIVDDVALTVPCVGLSVTSDALSMNRSLVDAAKVWADNTYGVSQVEYDCLIIYAGAVLA